MKKVPASLRTWFLIHFVVDIVFALPLFIVPQWTLNLFGFSVVEPLTARLVAAALFAIGGVSLLMHKKGKEAFVTMLNLKLVWSGAAIIGILITMLQGAPRSGWLFFALFFIFFLIWFYYKKQF